MTGLLLAALFIALNGFFVAAEFALVKLRATQLTQRVRKGEPRAILAQKITLRLDRYLSVTQLGVTLASLGLGWIGEPAITDLIHEPAMHYLPQSMHRATEIGSVVLALALLTYAHVLFGELVPKLIAIQRSEQTALFAAGPIRFIYLCFRPFLWILEITSGLVLRAMGLKSDAASEGTLSEDEILGILVANTVRSPGGKERSVLLERVLRFAGRTARHAMVSRVDVFSVPLNTPGNVAMDEMRVHGYSRVPITKEKSLDEVVGYLYVKDFLDRSANQSPDLSGLVRELIFVPENRSLIEVLRDMQRKNVLIAIVVDEYGGTSGLLTMEDLLEEIVGEIRDELDDESPRIVKVEERVWDVDGRATLEELGKAVGVHLDDAAETVGTVVLTRIARIPRAGDKVDLAPGLHVEVTGISRRRIQKVRVRTVPASPASVP
ncbi:MAG TPA: hemolysin family protein [Polyangiaceae bacterium]